MRAWLERSFRNRIFLTVLLVALVPLLLCDVLMTQVMIFRSEHTLRTDAQEEMALLTAQLDALLTDARPGRQHRDAQRPAPRRQRLAHALSAFEPQHGRAARIRRL